MKYLHLIIFSLLLSACAGTVTTLPTATNISKPPTITATFTLVPTITPTAVPPITSLTTWEKSEGERIAKEAGFASYADYLQKQLVENPAYDTKGESGGSAFEFYTFATAEGIIMDHASVPIMTEYWKNKGVEKAEVLLMAFEHTAQPVSVLAGFYLKDGSYASMLPLEVGVDPNDRSQDKLLKKPSDLDRLVGQLRSVRMVDRLTPGPNYDFLNTEGNWDNLKTEYSINELRQSRYDNLFVSRTQRELKLFEDALYNREGYVWTALYDAEGNLAPTSFYRETLMSPPNDLKDLLGSGNIKPEQMVAMRAYLLAHGDGAADNWMVVAVLGRNEAVFLR